MITRLSFLALFLFAGFLTTNIQAHDVFQDVLKEEYMLKSFSCKSCHPDSDDRKIRTPFADRIYEQMKGKGWSAKYAEAVKKDEAAKAKDKDFDDKAGAVAAFEKIVAKDFKEQFKVVAQQKMSFDDMIKQGLFYGARLDTKKIEAAKEAAGKK